MNGLDINFYANLKTTTKLSNNMWYRMGMSYFGPECESLMRLERDAQGNNMLTSKTNMKYRNIRAGLIGIFNINNLRFSRYDASMGLTHKSLSLAVNHVSNNQNDYEMGKVTGGAAYEIDKNSAVALMGSHNPNGKTKVVVGGEFKPCPHFNIKAKIDSTAKATAFLKFKLNDVTNVSVGT